MAHAYTRLTSLPALPEWKYSIKWWHTYTHGLHWLKVKVRVPGN